MKTLPSDGELAFKAESPFEYFLGENWGSVRVLAIGLSPPLVFQSHPSDFDMAAAELSQMLSSGDFRIVLNKVGCLISWTNLSANTLAMYGKHTPFLASSTLSLSSMQKN